jgi:thiol-disulfide isomerase/thioredoxin
MSRELETFLQQYPDLVLVNFWQEGCDASRYMAQMLATLEQFQRVSVLHLKLNEHRPWARGHGIFGTPALVVYCHSRALFRVIGRVTPDELVRRFRDLEVEGLEW